MPRRPHQTTVLILGADGFIGRHLAFDMRQNGWRVIACARRTSRLLRMGFETLAVDLNTPVASDPAFWAPHVSDVDFVVNAAGVLQGRDAVLHRVHVSAPRALYTALPQGTRGLLISAVGIEEGETGFARHRRAGEAVAIAGGITVLRAGLVLGDTSYGGSSLARALAALPLVTPVVGNGTQQFNPIHATDLAAVVRDCLTSPPDTAIFDIGGPQIVSQSHMLTALRGWVGLRPVPVLPLPLPVARLLGWLGDAMRMGPISRTSVSQLEAGVLARSAAFLADRPSQPRGFDTFVAARPAGTQDLWHARLYLMRPMVRLTLAFLWLFSGLLGLILPASSFLPLLPQSGLSDNVLIALARGGGIIDLCIGFALLRAWNLRYLAWIQTAMIGGYTLAFTVMSPVLWALPLGGLMKNIPLLVLVALHGILEEER